MKKILIVFCISFILGGIGFFLYPKTQTMHVSGTIAEKSKTDLIVDSDVIIRGSVNELLPSKWSNPGFKKGNNIRNILQTDVSINIKDIFKGTPYNNESILVRIDKGGLEKIVFVSDGYPDFQAGEEVILFLSKDDSDVANPKDNYYVLTGMSQGAFKLDKNISSDKEFASAFADSKDRIHLSTFKEEIKTVLEHEKLNPKTKMTPEEIRRQNEKVFGKY